MALNLNEYQSELKCSLKTPGLVPSPQRWGFCDPRIGLLSGGRRSPTSVLSYLPH